MFVCVINEKPKEKSVERPGDYLHSEIHTKIVEYLMSPLAKMI